MRVRVKVGEEDGIINVLEIVEAYYSYLYGKSNRRRFERVF